MLLDNKYKKWYFNIVESIRQGKYNIDDTIATERHHIIPKCLGGLDGGNIITVPARVHYILHKLLCRFTEGEIKYKLLTAFEFMATIRTRRNKTVQYNVKSYDYQYIANERLKVKFKIFNKVILWCNEHGHLPTPSQHKKYTSWIAQTCNNNAETYNKYMATEIRKFLTFTEYKKRQRIEESYIWCKMNGHLPYANTSNKGEKSIYLFLKQLLKTTHKHYNLQIATRFNIFPPYYVWCKQKQCDELYEWCIKHGRLPEVTLKNSEEYKLSIFLNRISNEGHDSYDKEMAKLFEKFPSTTEYNKSYYRNLIINNHEKLSSSALVKKYNLPICATRIRKLTQEIKQECTI